VAMCDKGVSTNQFVNTTEPVFNRLPSMDKNPVLALHHLDYVANCLPNRDV